MKIAVLLCNTEQSGSGAFTFEDSLAASLGSHASNHHFSFIDWSGNLRPVSDYSPPPSDPAPSSEQSLLPVGSRESRSLAEPVAHATPAFKRFLVASRQPNGMLSGLERSLCAERFDFLWFLSPCCVETSLPCAITVWDLEHRKQPFFPEVSTSGWTWDEREAFYSRFLPRTAAIVVGTEVGKSEVTRFYNVNPSNVIVNPFPVPPFPLLGNRDQLSLECSPMAQIRGLLGRPYFLYPAQFWPHKNHANLLLAMSVLRDMSAVAPTLVLTGADRGNQGYIDSLIHNLGLDSVVLRLGFVERDDLSRLYANAASLVFPSFFGPDNLPPLEAFAHGCPVLASDGDGPREQLGQAALFFDPADPADIAAKMLLVLGDERCRSELIIRGRSACDSRSTAAYLNRMNIFFDRFESIRFTWPAGYVHP